MPDVKVCVLFNDIVNPVVVASGDVKGTAIELGMYVEKFAPTNVRLVIGSRISIGTVGCVRLVIINRSFNGFRVKFSEGMKVMRNEIGVWGGVSVDVDLIVGSSATALRAREFAVPFARMAVMFGLMLNVTLVLLRAPPVHVS